MTDIQTVAGPVASSELGRTLVHEHVFVLGEEYRQNYQDDWDEEQKVEQAVRDLNEGDTGVRAAVLKCAIDAQGLTPGVERTMRAVAQASVETGAPITVHTHAGSEAGLVAQRILAEEGVDLTRVVIGHAGDSIDLDHLCRLADAGSLLGLDRFGLDAFLPLQQRIDTLLALVRRGYAESIVVSHDASCFMDFVTAEERPRLGEKWNYRLIPTEVIPALLKAGVSERTIEAILVDNPRRHLEGARA